jgi:starch synthase
MAASPSRTVAKAPPLRVLFVAGEIAPWVKTGGLGDVAAALPPQMKADGIDVRVLVPAYPGLRAALRQTEAIVDVERPGGAFPAAKLISATTPAGVPLLAVDCPALYGRDGNPYVDAAGKDWPDNDLRFGLLSRIAALVAAGLPQLGWTPDILHCNDWHTGLAPIYLRYLKVERVRSVFTIHNIAYQGIFPAAALAALALPPESFGVDGVEYFGSISFMKAAIQTADAITTVSPTHARELQTDELGFGLGGLLRHRAAVVSGILNGIDTAQWDPAADPHLKQHYGIKTLSRKQANKLELQRRFKLAVDDAIPLLGVVSRLTPQKGIDLLLAVAERILDAPAQLILLGTGDAQLEAALRALARKRSDRCAAVVGFDEALAHMIEAGADMFVMPSRYEPCGLNQMYSLRYGTPPVVRATGGLADTVVDCDDAAFAAERANGFVFGDATPAALAAALERALATWRNRERWQRLQANGMKADFSWQASGRRYRELYERLLAGAVPSVSP